MNLTYEEILNRMKNAYFNECGENVDNVSELGKRFQSVASELFALSCYGNFILKQAFVPTATGKYLDSHGRVRGCERKVKQKAQGALKFYIAEPAQSNIDVPEGTVCSVEGKPYLQFATTESGSILAGEISATVPAVSVGWGEEYNADPNEVTVMVNAPVGVLGVKNEKFFYGGYNEETDTAFRRRIIEHYNVPSNGINACSIKNTVKNLDFVTDCCIASSDTGGELTIYVSTKNELLTDEQKNTVLSSVDLLGIIGVAPEVRLAAPEDFNITVDVYVSAGYDKNSIKEQFEQNIEELCSARIIGRHISLGSISRRLIHIEGVSDFSIYSDREKSGMIYCGNNSKYLCLKELAVNCFDD